MKKIIISFALITGLMSATANVEAGLFGCCKKYDASKEKFTQSPLPEPAKQARLRAEALQKMEAYKAKQHVTDPVELAAIRKWNEEFKKSKTALKSHKLRNTAIAITTLATVAGLTYAAAHGYTGEYAKNICAKATTLMAPYASKLASVATHYASAAKTKIGEATQGTIQYTSKVASSAAHHAIKAKSVVASYASKFTSLIAPYAATAKAKISESTSKAGVLATRCASAARTKLGDVVQGIAQYAKKAPALEPFPVASLMQTGANITRLTQTAANATTAASFAPACVATNEISIAASFAPACVATNEISIAASFAPSFVAANATAIGPRCFADWFRCAATN